MKNLAKPLFSISSGVFVSVVAGVIVLKWDLFSTTTRYLVVVGAGGAAALAVLLIGKTEGFRRSHGSVLSGTKMKSVEVSRTPIKTRGADVLSESRISGDVTIIDSEIDTSMKP